MGNTNPKYKHIPLRIKYLFMDVQEYIETTNGQQVIPPHGAGFLQPKKLKEIHAEFCKENNMTQLQLRKLLEVKMKNQNEPKPKIKSAKIKNASPKITNFHQNNG